MFLGDCFLKLALQFDPWLTKFFFVSLVFSNIFSHNRSKVQFILSSRRLLITESPLFCLINLKPTSPIGVLVSN